MSYNQLTEGERYQIQSYLKAGYTQKEIADALGRSPSTISRELSRNRVLKGYRPKQAHRLATQRRLNAQKAIKVIEQVAGWVETLIRQELSPAQAAAYIANEHGSPIQLLGARRQRKYKRVDQAALSQRNGPDDGDG